MPWNVDPEQLLKQFFSLAYFLVLFGRRSRPAIFVSERQKSIMALEDTIHVWRRCHGCRAAPIYGECYHCASCYPGPDTDLCASCYELYLHGRLTHPPPSSHHAVVAPHRFAPAMGDKEESYIPWLDIPDRNDRSPSPHDGFLLRLEFCFRSEVSFGAYGFAVQTPRCRFILTALHVMGEVIAKCGIDATAGNHAYDGSELPRVIRCVNLYDVLKEKWMLHPLGTACPMLVLPDARIDVPEPISIRDIAAFSINKTSRVRPARLAQQAPRRGETVWLAARFSDTARTRQATVVEQTEHSYIFRYLDSSRGIPFTSGSPVLNSSGEVVGINIGEGRFKGRSFGHAHQVDSIRRHLRNWLSG